MQKKKLKTKLGTYFDLLTSDMSFAEIKEIEIAVQPDDLLVLYTDGVVEANNHDKHAFGEDRLEKLVSTHHYLSATDLKNKILTSIARFRGSQSPQDDLSLIVLKVK